MSSCEGTAGAGMLCTLPISPQRLHMSGVSRQLKADVLTRYATCGMPAKRAGPFHDTQISTETHAMSRLDQILHRQLETGGDSAPAQEVLQVAEEGRKQNAAGKQIAVPVAKCVGTLNPASLLKSRMRFSASPLQLEDQTIWGRAYVLCIMHGYVAGWNGEFLNDPDTIHVTRMQRGVRMPA